MEVVFPMPRTALRCAEDVSQYSNKSLGSMAPFLKLHAAEGNWRIGVQGHAETKSLRSILDGMSLFNLLVWGQESWLTS